MYQLESADRGDLTGTPPTGVTNKNFAQQWKTDSADGLDATGNWTDFWHDANGQGWDLKQERTHNKANETTDITETVGSAWVTPVHDAAGNMTTVPYPASPTNGLTLKYDAWNRLVSAQHGELWEITFEYDGLNRRIVQGYDFGAQGQYYDYLYHDSSWRVLERRYDQGQGGHPETLQPYWQYVWSARYLDSPILRDANTDTDWHCDDERIYYLTDANFNVTTLVDTGGDAIERYLYDPYGKATIYNGGWSSTRSYSSYANYILYTGRELDLNTGLYYYRNRYYHPGLGRFVSRDPIGYGGELNLYVYVKGKPIRSVDPSGTRSDDNSVEARYHFHWETPSTLLRMDFTGNRPQYQLNAAGNGNVPFGGQALWGSRLPVKVSYRTICPCQRILWVQIARVTQFGQVYKWPKPKKPDIVERGRGMWLLNEMMTDEGWYVDHFPGGPPDPDAMYGDSAEGSGNWVPATLTDRPGWGETFVGGVGTKFEFETCAVCADRGKKSVLHCVLWGFDIRRVTWYVHQRFFPDYTETSTAMFLHRVRVTEGKASKNFHAAIGKYNQFHKTEIDYAP